MRLGDYTAMTESTRDNLERFITQRGLKIKPWAKEAGLSDATVRSFLKGRTTSLSYSTLERLAQAAGATVDEMIGAKKQESNPIPPDQLVGVKHLEVHASAGDGFEVTTEPEGEPYYFMKSWLEAMFGGHDGKLRVIHFRGDSMLPTIHDGDTGIVLTGLTTDDFMPGSIYVLWDGRGLVVKRLEAIISSRPRLRVISDNTALYTPYEIDADDARIVGKVLWRGGRL